MGGLGEMCVLFDLETASRYMYIEAKGILFYLSNLLRKTGSGLDLMECVFDVSISTGCSGREFGGPICTRNGCSTR